MERGDEYRHYRSGERPHDVDLPFRAERGERPSHKRERPGPGADLRVGGGGGSSGWEPQQSQQYPGYAPSDKRGRYEERPLRDFPPSREIDGRREFAGGSGTWRGGIGGERGAGRFGSRGGYFPLERGRQPLMPERGGKSYPGPLGFEGGRGDYAPRGGEYIPRGEDFIHPHEFPRGGPGPFGRPGPRDGPPRDSRDHREHYRGGQQEAMHHRSGRGGQLEREPPLPRLYADVAPPPPRRRRSSGSRSRSRDHGGAAAAASQRSWERERHHRDRHARRATSDGSRSEQGLANGAVRHHGADRSPRSHGRSPAGGEASRGSIRWQPDSPAEPIPTDASAAATLAAAAGTVAPASGGSDKALAHLATSDRALTGEKGEAGPVQPAEYSTISPGEIRSWSGSRLGTHQHPRNVLEMRSSPAHGSSRPLNEQPCSPQRQQQQQQAETPDAATLAAPAGVTASQNGAASPAIGALLASGALFHAEGKQNAAADDDSLRVHSGQFSPMSVPSDSELPSLLGSPMSSGSLPVVAPAAGVSAAAASAGAEGRGGTCAPSASAMPPGFGSQEVAGAGAADLACKDAAGPPGAPEAVPAAAAAPSAVNEEPAAGLHAPAVSPRGRAAASEHNAAEPVQELAAEARVGTTADAQGIAAPDALIENAGTPFKAAAAVPGEAATEPLDVSSPRFAGIAAMGSGQLGASGTSPGDAAQQQQQQQRRRLGWGQGLARLKSGSQLPLSPRSAGPLSPRGTTGDQDPPEISIPVAPSFSMQFEGRGGDGSPSPAKPSGIAFDPSAEAITPDRGLRVRTTSPPKGSTAGPPQLPALEAADGGDGGQVSSPAQRQEEERKEGGAAESAEGQLRPANKETMVGRIQELDHEIGELEKQLAELRMDQQRLEEGETKLLKALSKLEQRPLKPLPAWSGSDVSDVGLSSSSEESEEAESMSDFDEEMVEAGDLPSPSASSTRRAPIQQPSSKSRRRQRGAVAAEVNNIDMESVPSTSAEIGLEARLGPAQRSALRAVHAATSTLAAEDICLEVMRQNKEKALGARAELGAFVPNELLEKAAGGVRVPTGLPAFAELSDLPQYKANLDSHTRNGHGVRALLRREYGQLLRHHVELAVEFRERAEEYSRSRVLQERLRRTPSTLSADKAAWQQQHREPLGSPLARSTSRARSGDIVRSDYEEKQAIATLQAIELVKHMTELPTQVSTSPRAARWAALLDVSRRVLDPVRELEERPWVRPWSEEEKRIFCDKFLLHHKEFAKIQAYLPHRTVQEVIALYYAIQHTDDFAHTRRKYLLRKRREQADANSKRKSQDTVLGMSIADPSAFNPNPAPTTVQRTRSYGPADPAGSGGVAGEGRMGRGGRGRSRCGGQAGSHPNAVNPAPPVPTTTGPRTSRHRAAVVEPPLFAAAAVPTESNGAGGGTRRTRNAGSVRDYAAMENADWEGEEPEYGVRGDKRTDPVADALFVEAVQLYGKDMKAIAHHIGNKTLAATRLYWSRHRMRLGLDEVLEERAAQGLDEEPYIPEGMDFEPTTSGPAAAPPLASPPAPEDLQDLDAMQNLMQHLLATVAQRSPAGPSASVGSPPRAALPAATPIATAAEHQPWDAGAPAAAAGPAAAASAPPLAAEREGETAGQQQQEHGMEVAGEGQDDMVAAMVAAALAAAVKREQESDGSVGGAAEPGHASHSQGLEALAALADQQPEGQQQIQEEPAAAAGTASPPSSAELQLEDSKVASVLPGDVAALSSPASTPAAGFEVQLEGAGQQECEPQKKQESTDFGQQAVLPLPCVKLEEEQLQKYSDGLTLPTDQNNEDMRRPSAPSSTSPAQPATQPQPAAPLSSPVPEDEKKETVPAPSAPKLMLPSQELEKLQGMLLPGGLLFDIVGDPGRCSELSSLLSAPKRLLESPQSMQLLADAVEQARLAYSAPGCLQGPPGNGARGWRGEVVSDEEGEMSPPYGAGKRASTSYWSQEEKEAFIRAFKAHGRDWSKLHSAVPAKTLTQIKNYYQNYRSRLGLDKLNLPASAVQPGSRKRKGSGSGSGGPERTLSGMVGEPSPRPERVSRRAGHADVAAAAAASSEPAQQAQQQPHRPKPVRPQTQSLVASGGFPLFRGPTGPPTFLAAGGRHTPAGTPGAPMPLAATPAAAGAADPSGILAQWVQRYNQSIAELMSGHGPSQQQNLAAAAALYGMFGGAGLLPAAFMAAARSMAPPPPSAASAAGMDANVIAAALPMLGMMGLGGMPSGPQAASPADQLARLLQGGGGPALAAAAAAMQHATPVSPPAASNQAAAALSMQLQAMMMANPAAAAALMGGMQGGIPPQLLMQAGAALRGGLPQGLPQPAPLHPSPQAVHQAPPPLFAPAPASAAAAAAAMVRPMQQQGAPTNLTSLLAAASLQQQQQQQAAVAARAAPAQQTPTAATAPASQVQGTSPAAASQPAQQQQQQQGSAPAHEAGALQGSSADG